MKGFVSYILGLCQKKEGAEVEFKSALGGFPGSFWETYSAFAKTINLLNSHFILAFARLID